MKINSRIQDIETIEESKFMIQTPKSAPLSFSRPKIIKRFSNIEFKSQSMQLWRQSSLSMTRDKSPSHKIPNAQRFTQSREDDLKHKQFLTLQLRQDIKSEKGIGFPKSNRPQHFIKGVGEESPSPANKSNYKSSKLSTLIKAQQNPQNGQTLFLKSKSPDKGITIPVFNSHHKSYIQHSKHRAHQPEDTIQNPGPGQYNHSWSTKKKHSSYSIRVSLKRFNQTVNHHPGPAAYTPFQTERTLSINAKGTIPKSNRTYLKKFQNYPGPNKYGISRFLQSYN